MRSRAGASRLVGRLAGAVADGEGVDWQAARRQFAGTDLEPVVRGLESLADRGSDFSTTSAAGQRPADAQRRLPPWFVAYAVLVVAQLGLTAVAASERSVAQVVAGWVFGIVGLLLVQRPPFDRRALALAGVFLSVAGACTEQLVLVALPGRAAVVKLLPAPEVLLPFFLWWFVRLFPHTRHASRVDRGATVAMNVAGATAVALWMASAAGVADLARGTADRGYWPLLFLICIPALGVMWIRRREAVPAEKTRVAMFAAGLALGIGPITATVVLEGLFPAISVALDRAGATTAYATLLYLFLLTVPFTTAYAARGSALLSVPALGREAARRALGRATLTSVVLASAGLLGAQLTLGDPGLATGVLACTLALGTLLLLFRRRLWQTLGLRGAETWSDLIARLGYELSTRPVQRAADVVEPMLAHLLRMDVALLVRTADGSFASLRRDIPRLEAQQALPLLLFQERTALLVSPETNGDLYACLPDADRAWIRNTGAAVLVPVQGASGASAVIALSSGDASADLDAHDLRGLEAVASSVALAYAAHAIAPEEDDGEQALECSACGILTADGRPGCRCEALLVPATIPQALNGKFLVSRRLGRGGMGVVYLARDLHLDREVALKTMPRVTAEAARRLRGEARAMAAVRHPHVGQIHGLETWNRVPVLVLEYMSGGMLHTRVQHPLDPGEAVDLVLALASGLEAVHAAGLLHRDVKPSNIGFDATGTPRLLDFGLSRVSAEGAAALDATGELAFGVGAAGTPLYMSPGVLGGAEPGAVDDVWSLLIVLYECLAGAHPFRGLDREHLRRRLEEGLPPLPAAVPRPLSSALLDALRVGRCPPTAAALRELLQHVRPPVFGPGARRVGFS